MAYDKWVLNLSALILHVFSIGRIDSQNCGGNYSTNDGVITSPHYPNVYDVSSVCTFRILLPTISSITLSFETFELDRSKEDRVSITCGNNRSQEQIVYRWSDEIPPTCIPWCNYVRMDLISDYFRSYNFTVRGFKVHYQASTKGCGNTVLTASSGTISSPNYPQNYNNDENCTYSIWARESSSFTLTFQAFQLEPDCRRDWVQIRCDNSGQVFPKYCGSTLPRPAYISNCNKVLIWFRTGHSRAFSGFSLQYSITPDGCGKTSYAGLSGVITSQNYPKPYTRIFPHCTYYLYPVSSVVLTFQSFDLEPFIDSMYGDSIKIDCFGNSSSDPLYFQGTILPPVISYSLCRWVRVSFYVNNPTSGTGFNIKYQINPLIAYSKIINSPKNFTVDVGSQVELNCTSSATGYYPSWTLSKGGKDEDTTVIASFCIVNAGSSYKYNAIKGGPGVCSLVITNATLAEAGVYTCIDVGLASVSSIVSVVVPVLVPTTSSPSGQDQSDSDEIFIVLIVLLVICALGIIGSAIFFIARRNRDRSREEGQQNTNQDARPASYSVETRATRYESRDLPIFVLSPESPRRSTRNDEYRYEHLNDVFDNQSPCQ